MSKKIGIITFHDTLNYGASMQCYALQKKLHQLGVAVEVIDYKCPFFIRRYSPLFVENYSLKKIVYMFFALKMNIIKQRKKKIFQSKYIKLSKKYLPNTIYLTNKEYDVFITGSDQVWNWHLTNFDRTYFLDFVDDNKKKYSYAASFGKSEIEEDHKENYKNLLAGFEAISVREESGQKILEELIDTRAEIVVDPVLLLSADEWKDLAVLPYLEGYIALYSINDTSAYECSVELSKQTGKRIVYLNAPLKKIGKFKKITELGPDEFVGWFMNADYIITDSFHGVVTSILFHKSFLALQDRKKDNANSRVFDLLSRLNLSDRIISDISQIQIIFESINYNSVDAILNADIEKSISFLQKIIGDLYE